MSITLPESITYGKVVGRFILAVGDTADIGELPDALAPVGKISFTSASPLTRETLADPPTTVVRSTITCDLNGNGEIVSPSGGVGVWLVAGVYRVTYAITGVTINGHDILVETTHDDLNPLDLTIALPPPGGAPITPSQFADLSATKADSDHVHEAAAAAVSADPGNVATLGADDLIYVAEPDPGIKLYATAAEVSAEVESTIGIFRAATIALLIPEYESGLYLGADILVQTSQTDGYGLAFPPDGGTMVQRASFSDGYGAFYVFHRRRNYDQPTESWLAWNAWVGLPLPQNRPSSVGLWQSGPLFGDDKFAKVQTGIITSEISPTNLTNVATQQLILMTDLAASCLRSGEMMIGTAAAAYSGLLDAGPTVVGTSALTAGNPAAVASTPVLATSRVEVTAAAAAVDAVAGLHIPLGAVSFRRGTIVHATFAVTGGLTSATRLLCGLVSTSQVAAAMSDIAPSALTHFMAVGYNSSETVVSMFGRGSSASVYTAVTSSPVSRSNNEQTIDIKLLIPQASSTPVPLSRAFIRTKTLSTLVASELGTLAVSGGAHSDPLSFFLRASAGGTSAQPKVALLRLRVGSGLDLGGA